MPRRKYDTKAEIDADYSFRVGGVEVKGLTRALAFGHTARPWNQSWMHHKGNGIIGALGWEASTPRFIYGDYFGFLTEALEIIQGIQAGAVVVCDDSVYAQSKKGESEEEDIKQDIRDAGFDPDSGDGLIIKNMFYDGGSRVRAVTSIEVFDVSKVGDRKTIDRELPAGFDVLTDDILKTLEDSEAVTLSANLHKLNQGRVIHYCTPIVPQDPGDAQNPLLNWKTLEDWKALLPNDLLLESGTYRLL